MNGKLIGGILLVVGISIGGGMLALPVATAQSGFFGALLLLFGAWMLMTLGAFLILEVNLWLPEDSNIVSMAKRTLGPAGAGIAWVSYILLLYSLLSAYIAGGSAIFKLLLEYAHLPLPFWADALIFVLFFGAIVSFGIKSVDWVTRGLMLIKFTTLILLLIFISPHIKIQQLDYFHSAYLVSAITVVITSFGFATVVPSLRSYFDSDVVKLRKVLLIGSMIPLICYILWVAAIIGEVPLTGKYGLVSILTSGHSTAALTQALIIFLHNPWVSAIASIFTSICVLTSFLGVSLCLTDFLADGLNLKKQGWGGLVIYGITFIPPFVIILLDPKAFLVGLSYAGICCVVLLILLPVTMAWQGRYHLTMNSKYQVWGGKSLLIIVALISVFIIVHQLTLKLFVF